MSVCMAVAANGRTTPLSAQGACMWTGKETKRVWWVSATRQGAGRKRMDRGGLRRAKERATDATEHFGELSLRHGLDHGLGGPSAWVDLGVVEAHCLYQAPVWAGRVVPAHPHTTHHAPRTTHHARGMACAYSAPCA